MQKIVDQGQARTCYMTSNGGSGTTRFANESTLEFVDSFLTRASGEVVDHDRGVYSTSVKIQVNAASAEDMDLPLSVRVLFVLCLVISDVPRQSARVSRSLLQLACSAVAVCAVQPGALHTKCVFSVSRYIDMNGTRAGTSIGFYKIATRISACSKR